MPKKIILSIALTFTLLAGGIALLPDTEIPYIENAYAQSEDLESGEFMFSLEAITHEDIKGGSRQSWIRRGINYIFERIVGLLAAVIGGLSVLMMSYGGFLILSSAGSEDMRSKGTNYIKYSLIGLAVVLGAYIIVTAVQLLIKSIYA